MHSDVAVEVNATEPSVIAQLIEARELGKVVTRTPEEWKGNGGCCALIELSE